MFTSEPTLVQRIERMIQETPKIDPHTHIRADEPNAPDLASLMSYHWVVSELKSVGMPTEDFDTTLPPDERVRRSIPYLKKMKNTGMSWCFFRILRDLYDFGDPEITESNYKDLLDKVAATGKDPKWAPHVLKDRCNIGTVVTSLGNRSADPARNPDNMLYMLDAHYLFCPGVATDLLPFFPDRRTKGEYYDAIRTILDDKPSTAKGLGKGLDAWLDNTVRDRVRFTNTFIPIEQRFAPANEGAVDRVLDRLALGETVSDADLDPVIQYVCWRVLQWHNDHRKAFQIAVGAEYFICDGKSIPRFQETWTSEMAKALHCFPDARFDLMMASDVLTQEVTVLARQFPNIYNSGYWWHNFFPGLIEKIVGLRAQVAPMTKIGGFLCDAYYAEWTYGKLAVIKKAMASALAKLVELGYYEEDEIPGYLFQILHETPLHLYDLGLPKA